MPPTDTQHAELDLAIDAALVGVRAARAHVERSRNPDSEGELAAAEAELDRLLDIRLTRQPVPR
jgi:hypothetical protein